MKPVSIQRPSHYCRWIHIHLHRNCSSHIHANVLDTQCLIGLTLCEIRQSCQEQQSYDNWYTIFLEISVPLLWRSHLCGSNCDPDVTETVLFAENPINTLCWLWSPHSKSTTSTVRFAECLWHAVFWAVLHSLIVDHSKRLHSPRFLLLQYPKRVCSHMDIWFDIKRKTCRNDRERTGLILYQPSWWKPYTAMSGREWIAFLSTITNVQSFEVSTAEMRGWSGEASLFFS